MCDSQNNLFLGNQLVLTIVRTRYETDIFDIMLQNTKLCIKCIGRLQQLHEFCAHNAVVTPNVDNDEEEDNGKKNCDMCQLSYSPYELLPTNMLVGVDLTEWLKHPDEEEENREVISCYSCYCMICLYNETKDQLTQLLDYFYSALNNCKVIVKDCGSNADQGLANFEQEQFFGSLSLTPVEKSNHSRRSRVSFAPDVEVIPEPRIKRQRMSRGNCNVASESVIMMETASCEDITPIANKVPIRQNTRNLRNSIGGEPRIVSPAIPKIKKTRCSTSAIDNTSSFEALKRQHNILECTVKLEKLPIVIPAGSDQKKNENKGSTKKKPIKIKLNAKSKIIKRQMSRSMRSEKKNASDELENSVNLEVVLTQENLNNSQSSTMSADPLNASINEDTVQYDSSSFALDDTLPVTSPIENLDASAQIKADKDNNNKVSSKENNDAPVFRSTRKTRNSGGKLTESTNVAENNRATRKRKVALISPKKEAEDLEPESNENVEMIDDDEFIKYSPEEPEENLEQRYLLEIEFLNPVQYNNKAVKLNSTAMNNNEEEMELLSTSQENFMALSSEDLEMNAEYLDESLEETLMNTRNSPQNDALCPIYTMDQLLNEDSLLSLT